MQRVAIARALANRPRLVLADEPTGELDQATGQAIAGLFDRLHQDGTAVVVVTHDPTIAARAQRTLRMRDGRIDDGSAGVIARLALRSLLMHPVRTAVLAGGFGLGIAVMANLLGVADVVLEQSESPALAGGGDVLVTGAVGRLTSGRYLIWGGLGAPAFAPRVQTAAPTARGSLYLVEDGVTTLVRARGGIPSLERALGDPETSGIAAWQDTDADRGWVAPDAADVLRGLDRFHPVPDVPARAGSWAEWLYFNGQAGDTRFYLTFLVGPRGDDGRRAAGVRLQLDRGGDGVHLWRVGEARRRRRCWRRRRS